MPGKNKIAVILALITMILALSAAAIKYIRRNEIDFTVIAAGIAIPLIIIAIASRKNSSKII